MLTVDVVAGERAPRLVVAGDLDLDGAQILDKVVADQAPGSPIECDLAGVEFLDSSGLRSLLVHRQSRGATVVAPSPAVTHVCELAAVMFLLEHPEPVVEEPQTAPN